MEFKYLFSRPNSLLLFFFLVIHDRDDEMDAEHPVIEDNIAEEPNPDANIYGKWIKNFMYENIYFNLNVLIL